MSVLIVCGGHGSEKLETMRRQQELLMQLRALVLPLLHGVHDTSADIAAQLFDDVIGCNVSVASKLEGCLITMRWTRARARRRQVIGEEEKQYYYYYW